MRIRRCQAESCNLFTNKLACRSLQLRTNNNWTVSRAWDWWQIRRYPRPNAGLYINIQVNVDAHETFMHTWCDQSLLIYHRVSILWSLNLSKDTNAEISAYYQHDVRRPVKSMNFFQLANGSSKLRKNCSFLYLFLGTISIGYAFYVISCGYTFIYMIKIKSILCDVVMCYWLRPEAVY